MLSRVVLIVLGVFWAGMNVLLWRAERILTAPAGAPG